jgi:hypothetical protein
MDWWSGAVLEGPRALQRQVPLRELPLYLRENSLLVLGPVRSHVGERPADPLTVEAFVTSEATFALRTDAGRVDLQCRRDQGRIAFEASAAPPTIVLRVHDVAAPSRAEADGQILPRLDRTALDGAERGWTVDGRTVVLKARARELRAE